LLIGGSVGGFQALEWSILHPDKIKNLVLLACNARFTPWGSAFNESQRMALFADHTFAQQNFSKEGDKYESSGGKNGLAAARSIALLSYRSYAGYNSTQQENDINCTFPKLAASYQQYQGKKLVDRFNPYSYLSMLNLTDSHNIARGRNSIKEALKLIKAKTVCVGINSDILFPCEEQKFMAENITGGIYREINSKFGHDGFLLEWEQIKNIIEQENLI
jgi:Homoserine acetyltransferase